MSDRLASDPQLRRWYLRYNDVFFGGELPYEVPVYWEPSDGNLGQTMEFTVAEKGEAPDLVIRIDPTVRFSKVMAKITLLHEMVHVKLAGKHDGHGKPFDDEIRRLCGFREYRKLL